ncbi:MAG: hypothetical protein IPI17_15575 [Nitrosomonas sp.]|nr:hypothetical protein [Nitrosomonas sp.]
MMTSFLLVKGLRIAMMYQGVNVEGLEAYPVAVFFVFRLRFPMGKLSGCHVGRNHTVYRKNLRKAVIDQSTDRWIGNAMNQ